MSSSASPLTSSIGRIETAAFEASPRRGGRLAYVEAIRGLTCVLVVLYHAIGNDPAHGLRVAPGSIGWTVARLLDVIDMPLFAFVSGRVFGIETLDGRRFLTAFSHKALRLVGPLISVTTLFLVITHLSRHGTLTDPSVAFTQPFEHLWYLQASLCLVSVAAIGTWVFRGQELAFAVAAVLVAVIATLTVPGPTTNYFSWFNALHLAPYFFLGYLLKVASNRNLIGFEGRGDRVDTAIFGSFFLIGLLNLWAVEAPFVPSVEVDRAHLLIGVALMLLLATHAPQSALLAKLAERSYTIYLFHVFVMSPMRMVVVKLWPEAPTLMLLIVSLIAGIGIPWMLHTIFIRHSLTALLFQGVMPSRVATPHEVVRA